MKKAVKQSFTLPLLGAVALFPSCTGSATQKEPPPPAPKPNVIFILIDDLGYHDLGCYGSTFYETPNIDKLASESMRFTNAYAACPVSSPTRASVLTGKYPARHGITDWISGRQNSKYKDNWPYDFFPEPFAQHMALEDTTIAEALKPHGYVTAHFGKWHLGGEGFMPQNQGFDVAKGGTDRGGPYGGGGYFAPYGVPGFEDTPAGEFLTDRITREAMSFIEANKDTTFFLYLPYYAVHNPIMAKDSLIAKYKAKAEKLGYNDAQRFSTTAPWIAKASGGDYKERLVQDMAEYAALIEIVDTNVGLLLAKLQSLDIEDNTIIFFTSDNGGLATSEGSNTSNLPLRAGKGWLYEGGIREPLIIRWPGVTQAGSVSDALVTTPDYYPTILEMAGVPFLPTQHIDGISLVPAINGEPLSREMIFWHYPHYSNQGGRPASAIRKGDYKLIQNLEDSSIELYDLKNDIGETHNLAQELPQVADELLMHLEMWKKNIGAKGIQPYKK